MFIFVFIFITLGGRSKKILLWFKSKSVIFSFKSFIVSDLKFRSLVHFVFIFVYGVSEVKWKSLSRIWLFATPWTILLMESMEFSRPEYWSGWPFSSPGDLPNPEIEPRSPTLQADSLPAEPQGKVLGSVLISFFYL